MSNQSNILKKMNELINVSLYSINDVYKHYTDFFFYLMKSEMSLQNSNDTEIV